MIKYFILNFGFILPNSSACPIFIIFRVTVEQVTISTVIRRGTGETLDKRTVCHRTHTETDNNSNSFTANSDLEMNLTCI